MSEEFWGTLRNMPEPDEEEEDDAEDEENPDEEAAENEFEALLARYSHALQGLSSAQGFWRMVQKTPTCWNWLGYRDKLKHEKYREKRLRYSREYYRKHRKEKTL